MRLKEHEIASIKRCAERHFGPNCAVRLFGSRADDGRRGGDIDLHVQVDDDAASTMACRVRYLSDLEAALGERKVDLVVEGPTRKNGYIDRVAQNPECFCESGRVRSGVVAQRAGRCSSSRRGRCDRGGGIGRRLRRRSH
jgi:predicted nucleotidyltransferase